MELNDRIANANDFETCVSDARVSVRVQLLEKSRVQALDKPEKETADVSSRDRGGTTNVIVDLKFQGKVLSRMQTRLLMCLQKASDRFGTQDEIQIDSSRTFFRDRGPLLSHWSQRRSLEVFVRPSAIYLWQHLGRCRVTCGGR